MMAAGQCGGGHGEMWAGLRGHWTDAGVGLGMGSEEGKERGGFWMAPTFQLAQLSGRLRWGH